MTLMTHYDKALAYVRSNRTWTEEEEAIALRRINEMRCNLSQAAPRIAEAIADLMEEYGECHDLPEGWWLEYGDEDSIFFDL